MGEVKILLSPEEHEKVKAKADSRGMSVRAYVKNAALQRRDKRTNWEVVASLDAVHEILEENVKVLESLDKRLTSLFYYTEEPEVTLYADLLVDADVSFHKLEREMTRLVMLISGD